MPPTGLPETPEALLRRIGWKVVKRLDGRLQGDYRTLLHGNGTDVAEIREYVVGDDVRHIDWNVTARTDTPHVRTFLEDRNLTSWLLIDRSASMMFGRSERTKNAQLVDVTMSIARVLSRGGNTVGAVLFDTKVERVIAPRTGRNHLLHLARELTTPVLPTTAAPRSTSFLRRRARQRSAPLVTAPTNLADLLDAALQTMKRRSLVIVASDFISAPGWDRPLRALTARHDVVALWITDPRESELPDAGFLVVEDAETGELVSVDTSDTEFRRRYTEVTQAHAQEIRDTALRAGVDLHPVSTDDDLVAVLIRIIERRARQRRR